MVFCLGVIVLVKNEKNNIKSNPVYTKLLINLKNKETFIQEKSKILENPTDFWYLLEIYDFH